MPRLDRPLPLDNPVRHYDWGSPHLLPELLGRPADGRPWAELWMGAHPGAPSSVELDGARRPLDVLVEQQPDDLLGERVHAEFGPRLPFLLKVLSAARPLSLQCHPSPAQAAEGCAREDAAGLARDAPDRTYRDDQHKPELLLALTRFDALCGFRPVEQSRELLAGLGVPGLAPVLDDLAGPDPVRRALTRLVGLPDARDLVAAVAAACHHRRTTGSAWDDADATVEDLARDHPADPGVVVSLLLQRVTLEPGQAVFLPAGNLHAYLGGLGVEVMASSDNVLRGGLTTKHVDAPELLRVVDVEPADVPLVDGRAVAPGLTVLAPPVAEFCLGLLTPYDGEVELPGGGPRVVLCTEGALDVGGVAVPRGGAVLVPAVAGAVVVRGEGHGVVAATAGGL